MKKSQVDEQVGDLKSPSLMPNATGLRGSANLGTRLSAGDAPNSVQSAPIKDLLHAPMRIRTTCYQNLWFSFFFDGTGNNLDADESTLKHSNVAKLYRAHPDDDPSQGIYRFYVPGVGTYFKAIGDDGGGTLGLGMGKLGEARIAWAIKEFDKKIREHIVRANNPSNALLEVNLSVFGFSRGAALARAFVNIFLNERCVATKGGDAWVLKTGRCPLRIPFMGLFDTVASVGVPMSSNNTSVVGAAANSVSFCIEHRLKDKDLRSVTPVNLAFAERASAGADPAIGAFDGHSSWGGQIKIPEMIEEVRHFVAAHEIRNSFPLDSVTVLEHGKPRKPAHFHETVYPGVHSDVGGSYRPGEGGRSYESTQKLGLIPLIHMYEYAIAQGVPLLPRTAWEDLQNRDFAIGKEVRSLYNHYMSKLGANQSLGTLINAHMELYYAWRFRSIRQKMEGDSTELAQIARSRNAFEGDAQLMEKEVAGLEKENNEAQRRCRLIRIKRNTLLNNSSGNLASSPALKKYDDELRNAEVIQGDSADRLLRAKARLDSVPNMSKFGDMLEMYEQRLLSDVRDIRKTILSSEESKSRATSKRNELRPHYLGLVAAYENEFIYRRGLSDKKIIAFFDTYVHDSLSGFAKDATLPSDPRVIYVGGDQKLRYASIESEAQLERKSSFIT